MKLKNWWLVVAACLLLILVYVSEYKARYKAEENAATESKLREKELAFQKEKEATRLRIHEEEKQAEEDRRREAFKKDSKNTPEYLMGYNEGHQDGCRIFTMHPNINWADTEKIMRAAANINSSDYQRGYANGIMASIVEIENVLKASGVPNYSEYSIEYFKGQIKGFDDAHRVCTNSPQDLEELNIKSDEVYRNKSFGYIMGYNDGVQSYMEIHKKYLDDEKEAILRSNQLRRELLRETFRGD
jgi:hypothetical protein